MQLKLLIVTNNGFEYYFKGNEEEVITATDVIEASMKNGFIGHISYNGTYIRVSDVTSYTIIRPWYTRLFERFIK